MCTGPTTLSRGDARDFFSTGAARSRSLPQVDEQQQPELDWRKPPCELQNARFDQATQWAISGLYASWSETSWRVWSRDRDRGRHFAPVTCAVAGQCRAGGRFAGPQLLGHTSLAACGLRATIHETQQSPLGRVPSGASPLTA